jgi:hypothetical protein
MAGFIPAKEMDFSSTGTFDTGGPTEVTHAEVKELIEAYHAKAKEKYAGTNVYISDIKNIQITENGAFVEAMVWIPKESLNLS